MTCTVETFTEPRNRMYVDRLGYAYCHECAPETSVFAGPADNNSEFVDRCRTCRCVVADKPEMVTGTAVVEHFACKIF